MAIFVTYLTFKWDMFIVQLLDVSLVIHFELDGHREAFTEINFNTYVGTSLHVVLWLTTINKLSNNISNGSNRFISPTMEREMRELNPDWDRARNIQFKIKIQGPFVEVQASGVHEIWSIPKD